MSLSYYKIIGFPTLTHLATLLKAFYDHTFHTHYIIPVLPIELSGKNIFVEFEMIDAPLEYNLLIYWSWFYVMMAITSLAF